MAVSGISLIQKLQRLFGARAVSDMMGRTTNVQTLAQGTNNPFARTFSKKYLAKNKDGVEEASRVILENMQYAFGNKNIKQMKNFEANVDTLYNLKFPPKPTEAKVVNIGTKKQVTGEGLESLKDDLGIPEDIPPTSPLGESITKAKRKDKVIDPEDKAQGGRAGFKTGGITKLLNLLQGKFGKKAITTADKIDRPESALNRDMFKEFNERVARKTLNVPETPSGFKLSRERLLKNYPEIDEDFADQIMAMDRDMQIRIIEMIKDRRKNPKAYDKLLMEKGDSLDFQGEFDRSVKRSKNAQGGIAGQLHMNEGGRVGFQTGGMNYGYPVYDPNELMSFTGSSYEDEYTPEELELMRTIPVSDFNMFGGMGPISQKVFNQIRTMRGEPALTYYRGPTDQLRVKEYDPPEYKHLYQQYLNRTAEQTPAPTTATPTTTAPTTAAPTPTGTQTIPDDKKVFNVMTDEKGNVMKDQSLTELFRETGTAPQIGIGGPASINSMSDVFRLAGITGEDGISMGTDYSGTTLPSGGIANTLPVKQRMQAAAAKGLDPRMGRTYAENIQAMADPRMLPANVSGLMQVMPPSNTAGMRGGFAEPVTLDGQQFTNEADAIAALGIERYNQLMASGGRVGLKKGGPPNPGRRNFMKLMAGLASLPIVGKLFKFAKPASKIVQLKNTTTAMPEWFPKFVDKFINRSVGTKIDADITEFKNSDIPDIKITRHDDG